MGKDFWGGLLDWVKDTLAEKYKTISPEDLDLFHLTDSEEEAVDYVTQQFDRVKWKQQVRPTIPGPRLDTID